LTLKGKTTLLKRYVDNNIPSNISNKSNNTQVSTEIQRFDDEMFSTNQFYENEEFKLVFIDTPGQSEFTPFLQNKYFIGK